ncbi:MAG: gliding motility-associated C-terminal domain-containing protein [Ginsengibacter sp.]
MKRLLFLFSVLFTHTGFSQCPFAVTLATSGNCTGDTLLLSTTNQSISKITWYNGSVIADSAAAVSATGITVAGGNGFGSAADQFFSPQSICLDASGNLYVSDAVNERIQKFPPGSTRMTNGITVAGGNGGGSGANQVDYPIGICIDAAGNLYIADELNQRVQKWAPEATFGVTVAGGNGKGNSANQFNDPYDVAVDALGNLYVVDWLNNRVQKFPPGSTSATNGVTVAGGNGAGTAANQLYLPTNVFVDASGNIYVTDRTNERIQKWAPGATSGITVAGGNGIGSAANQLDAPFGIFVDPAGYLYVADYSNSRIQRFPPGSTGATDGVTVAGGNGFGNAANQFNGPGSVFVTANGDIYVEDFQNERVQKWSNRPIDTTFVTLTAGTYTAIVTDSSGCSVTTNPVVISPSVSAQISIKETGKNLCSGTGTFIATVLNGGTTPHFQWQVNGSDVGTDQNRYSFSNLADGDSIICVMRGNAACMINSLDTSNTVLITAPPVVSIKSQGGTCLGDTLFVNTNHSASQITWYEGDSIVDTSRAVLQDSGITVAGGNGVGILAKQLNRPSGIFVDSQGNIYVADEDNGRVQTWTPGATKGVTVARRGLATPAAVFVDAHGYLYVSDIRLNSVVVFPPGSTSTTAGVTVAGGNGIGSLANQLNSPISIFVASNGDLYVADQFNERVQKFPPGSTSSTQGVTMADNLGNPVGIFLDAAGNLYISESGYSQVSKWTPGSTTGLIVAGGNGQGKGANQFDSDVSIYVDPQGNVYVADETNNRIQKWPPGASSGITVAGGNGAGLAENQLSDPVGLFLDASGNIYATDYLKNSVQKWAQGYLIDSIYIPSIPGSYKAVVTNSSGCSATTSSITIEPVLTPKITITASNTSVCTGTTIKLRATALNGGTNPTYQWQVNGHDISGATASLYATDTLQNGSSVRCILISNAPCTTLNADTSNSITISVGNRVTPVVTISATQNSVCAGTPITFDAIATNGGSSPVFQWMVNGNNAPANGAEFTSDQLSDGDVVTCEMTSNATCASPDTSTSKAVTLKISPHVTPGVTITVNANPVCEGTPVMFTAMPTNGGDDPRFQWIVNGINSGINSSTFSSGTLHKGDMIYCILTSSLSCASQDSSAVTTMTVNPKPSVLFTPDTVYSTNGVIQLNPVLSGAITQYQWSPSTDLDNTTIARPVSSPLNEISYQLRVSTDSGCTATGKVTVIAGRPLNIPNIFTPNRDGHNDVFRIPPGVQFTLQELAVFDGWGNKIFVSNDIKKGWDGTYHGAPAETGVYVYLIKGQTPSGNNLFLKGTVLLAR